MPFSARRASFRTVAGLMLAPLAAVMAAALLATCCHPTPAHAQTWSPGRFDPATGDYPKGIICVNPTTGAAESCSGGSGGSAPSATAGSAAATTSSPISGSDGTTERRVLLTPSGALQVANATPTSTGVVSIPASTATLLRAASANSRGLTIQTESANSAPIYVCLAGQANCSATVHDVTIPVSTAVGAQLVPLYGVTAAVYVFSTAATSASGDDWVTK